MAAVRFVIRNYQRSGLSVAFEIVTVDEDGDVVTNYTGTVNFSAVGSTIPGLPASYTFVPGDSGVHAFSTTLQTIDNVQIFAVDAGASVATAGIYVGGGGPDTFTGAGGGDVIDPNGGTNNPLTGNAGEDTFYLRGGINTLAGGDGVDRLIFDLRGNGARLRNQPGVPIQADPAGGMQGAFTNDQDASVNFTGIENITILTNNNADDNITTGSGDDEYSQVALDSPFYIRDVVDLGGGNDQLSVDARATNGSLSFLALNYDGSGEVALYGNGKIGFSNVESFYFQGGNAADVLRGLDGADWFAGNAGNDTLIGSGGEDDLRGGAGNDIITGDGRITVLLAADNQNNAGTGVSDNDFRVTGTYTAANPAEFTLFAGTANIGIARLRIRATDVENDGAGFPAEIDEIYVNDVLIGTLAQFADNATGDTIFTFDAALIANGVVKIRIQNVNPADQGAYGFRIDDVELTVEKTGNDRLDGGRDVDFMAGGNGDDVYVVDEERDAVQELDGGGIDTVLSSAGWTTLGANVENLEAVTPMVARPTVETLINPTVIDGSQHPNSITILSDGGYVITWSDVPRADVRARVFNADGSPRGDEFLVHSASTGEQGVYGVSSVALTNGGFLIAYFDTPGGATNERIMGRAFDANGVAQGAEYILTDTAGTYDSFPEMTRLDSGQIALISQNGVSDGSGTFAISYRLLNADGSPTAAAPVIFNTTTAGDQVGPVVTKLDDGRLIVVWESGEPGGKVFRGRYIAADGTPSGSDFIISTAGGEGPDSSQTRAAVTAINGGGFAVAWAVSGDIYGRVFDSDGLPIGQQFVVNPRTAGTQSTVAITRLAEGGFIAAWTSDGGEDGDAHGVIARLFDGDGNPRGDDFVVNQIGTRFQLFPELATLPDGRVVVAFSSDVPGSGGNYEGKQIILDTTPDQVLVGNELANSIVGGWGDDVIAGSSGGDTLTGNQGADIIIGGDFTRTGENFIVNGGFETQDGTNNTRDHILAAPQGTEQGITYRGVSSLFGWVHSPNVPIELQTSGGPGLYAAADGTASINLEYAQNHNLSIYQDIADLIPGQTYVLRFAANMLAFAQNFSAVMQVVWNGVIITTIVPDSKTPGFYTALVVASEDGIGVDGSNRLEFREISSSDFAGTTLDAVSLQLPTEAAAMPVGPMGPNLIVNGSFEQRDATTSAYDYTLTGSTDFNGGEPIYRFSDQLLGWGFLPGTTRIEFNIDNPNNGRNEFQTGDGLVVLDLAVGSESENFGIFQDVTGLGEGERYRITVSAALPIGPDQSAALQVIWNGRIVGTIVPTSTTPTDYSFDVYAQATGSGVGGANRIAFQEVGGTPGSARGAVVDNVRLNLVTAADAGTDTVDYARENGTGGVVVNLSAIGQNVGGTVFDSETARDSFGSIDQLVNIENVITGAANDTVYGNEGVNVITTGVGNDVVIAGGGDDIFNFNVTTDGGDFVVMGTGADRVLLSGDAGQIRLTFTSAGVGNGNPFDPNLVAGLNVRLQAENGADGLTGLVSRFDDEGITFVAGAGQTFDVRDFASGAQRGDTFGQVDLGTSGDDVITPGTPVSTVNYYANGGGGADTVTTGAGNDFLVGGDGADILRGLSGTDTLLGGAGDDALTGGTGNDAVVGGGGTDRGIVSDAVTLAAFSLTGDADPTAAGNQPGWRLFGATDGTDTLSGVEIVDGGEAGRILLVGSGAFADEAAAMAASTATADQILFAGNRSTGATEDVTYTLTTRDFGFVDLDGDSSVGVRIATLPPGTAGVLQLNGVAVTAGQVIAASAIIAGNLTFVPTLNANGPTNLTFQLTDPASGVVSAQVNTLTLNVAAVNDAPVLTMPSAPAMNEDATLAIGGISIADVDVGSGTATVTLGIADGVLALGSSSGVTVIGSGNALTLTGTLTNLNTALATLSYAPPLNANGARTLTVTVNDGGNTGSGGALTDTESVAITINPVNDAPSGVNVSRTINEDSAYTFATTDLGFTDPVEGNALLAVVLTTVPANGSILLNGVAVTAGNAITAADITAGLLRFVPIANANGAGYGNFTFQVCDDGGTSNGGINTDPSANSFTLNVTAVDDASIAGGDSGSTAEDAAITLTVLANDSDIDGPVPSVAWINGTSAIVGTAITLASGATATLNANGTISYNPSGRFDYLVSSATAAATGASNGSAADSFTYTLASGITATVNVTVNGVDGVGDELRGSGGNNSISGTSGTDYFDLSQGGTDTVNGGDGNDGFFFGGQFTTADTVDGGAGDNDQIGLQGDYSGGLTLQPNAIIGVELIGLLAGTGNGYSITTHDQNVAAGARLTIFGTNLAFGNDLTFDGSAETDGIFHIYGGAGTDIVTGGAGNDGFWFGPGRFDPSVDRVRGGGGTNDQLALDGDYAITLDGTAIQGIETITLQRGPASDINSFDLTLADSLVADGETLTIWGHPLLTSLIVNGSAESDGNLRIYGGAVDDTIATGAGDDWIWGGAGGDRLTGGADADIFFYDDVSQSTGLNYDTLVGFDASEDRIDLPFAVTGMAAAVNGALSLATFDDDLAAAIGAAQLAPGQAVVFTAVGGDMDGQTFLIVNGADSAAGYQADGDYVFHLDNPIGPIVTPDPFV